MSSITPYLDRAAADTILGSTLPWDDAGTTDAMKDDALVQARLYFDKTYACPDHDPDVPSDTVKEANALLANAHLTSSIFTRQTNNGPLEEIEVKAEGVSSRKRYNAKGVSAWVDPFPQITALVYQDGCLISVSQGLSTVSVVRA
jgi:hypothetical protein